MTDVNWWIGAGVFLASWAFGACAEDAASPLDGRYVGDTVSFELSGGVMSDIRLSGIECRVPHPDNPVLALCLERAPGLVDKGVPLSGLTFAADLGDVTLSGVFDTGAGGASVSGSWSFQTVCGLGDSTCESDGSWTATWRAPIVVDAGVDAAGEVDAELPPSDAAADLPSDAGPDVAPGPLAPNGASAAQSEAQILLLDRRFRAGVGPITMTTPLNAAAQDHAAYYVAHASKYQSSGLSPHRQNEDWAEGFTGVTLGDRLTAVGASGGGASEVMAFSATTEGAIDGWMDTLYHRIPLVHPNAERWGYGEVLSPARGQVGDVLMGATQSTIARWPAPQATGVPRSWNGFESPQPPLPVGESYPSGPVITVTFGHSVAGLTEASLTNLATGETVGAVSRDPTNDSWLSSTWALYAFEPLDGNTAYEVVFSGGGAPDQRWEFTTAP